MASRTLILVVACVVGHLPIFILPSASATLKLFLFLLHLQTFAHANPGGVLSMLNSYASVKAPVPKFIPLKHLSLGTFPNFKSFSLPRELRGSMSGSEVRAVGAEATLGPASLRGYGWMWADIIGDLRAHSSAAQQAQIEHIGGQAPGLCCQSHHTAAGLRAGRWMAIW